MTLANQGGFRTQLAAHRGDRVRRAGASYATARAVFALAFLTLLMLLFSTRGAHAVGTPSGTTIASAATVNYSVAGVPIAAVTNLASFRVDELISVRFTPPATPANANTPDTNRVLVFRATNVGNGSESFTLTPNLSPAVADQFNPQTGSAGILYVDVNNNGQLDIGIDTPISAPLTINPDQTIPVLFVANMPSGLANGDQGVVTLSAASATAGATVSGVGAAPGTVLPNAGTPMVGTPGIDAVIGYGAGGVADSGADDTASGAYIVGAITVTIAKTVIAVTSPQGVTTTGCNAPLPPSTCSAFLPGSIVQYQLTVTLTGAGVAQNVLITDNIPANTTYVANSIRFNGAARTDQADADNATCPGCGNAAGTVTVNVGNVTVNVGTPVTHLIDYRVTIN